MDGTGDGSGGDGGGGGGNGGGGGGNDGGGNGGGGGDIMVVMVPSSASLLAFAAFIIASFLFFTITILDGDTDKTAIISVYDLPFFNISRIISSFSAISIVCFKDTNIQLLLLLLLNNMTTNKTFNTNFHFLGLISLVSSTNSENRSGTLSLVFSISPVSVSIFSYQADRIFHPLEKNLHRASFRE